MPNKDCKCYPGAVCGGCLEELKRQRAKVDAKLKAELSRRIFAGEQTHG